MSIYTTEGLLRFISIFIAVSITPGMCMTLAMTMGIHIGFLRTLGMMAGELIGVALIVSCTVFGVGVLMLQNPSLFIVFKICGGLYLGFLGVQMWCSVGDVKLEFDQENKRKSLLKLASIGFITAIINPKGWAFFIALLPPFINYQMSLAPQLLLFNGLILPIEFISLCAYTLGGSILRRFLQEAKHVRLLNRASGFLMVLVGIWLIFG